MIYDYGTRLTTFAYDELSEMIYAGDDKGVIHAFSNDLVSHFRSPSISHGMAIGAIALDRHYLYTRDIAGNLVRWDKATLAPLDFIVTDYMTDTPLSDSAATPVPSPSQALKVIGNTLLVANSRGSITVIDVSTFTYSHEINATEGAFPECILEGPDGNVWVTDVAGRVFKGGLNDKTFYPVNNDQLAVVHRLVFDPHSRKFWGTCDGSGSLFFLDESGAPAGSLRLTTDDVEDIAITQDGRRAYVGCFDHHVHVLDATSTPVEIGLIGPFKFQVNHIALINDLTLVVMLESGELYLVEAASGRVLACAGGTTAAWQAKIQGKALYICTENGTVQGYALQETGQTLNLLELQPRPLQAEGRIRRFVMLSTGWIIHAGSVGDIICSDGEGVEQWRVATAGIVRDITHTPDESHVFVVNEVGELFRIATATGSVEAKRRFPKPLWCAQCIDPKSVAVGERTLSSNRGSREASLLHIIDADSLHTREAYSHTGNHKNIELLSDGRLLVTGNGKINVRVIDPTRRRPVEEFAEWIINTPEAACIYKDRVYVVTYGYQLITYDSATREAIDVQMVMEGFPTSLQVYETDSNAYLIATGRNFVSVFLITDQFPALTLSKYLSGHAAASPHFHATSMERVSLSEKSNSIALLELEG
jgi:hypothetical protein